MNTKNGKAKQITSVNKSTVSKIARYTYTNDSKYTLAHAHAHTNDGEESESREEACVYTQFVF